MASSIVSVAEILESYSRHHPKEVLLVSIKVDDRTDEVMVFKGFSSSLMHSTAYDADVAVIPSHSEILHVSLLQAPYQPNAPKFLREQISWEEFLQLAA